MKKNLLFLALLQVVFGLHAQTLKFSSLAPEAGKSVIFVYIPKNEVPSIRCEAVIYTHSEGQKIYIPLQKEGNQYKGSFSPPAGSTFATLSFQGGQINDAFYTFIHKNKQANPVSYLLEAQYYLGMLDIKGVEDSKKAFAAFNKANKADARLKNTCLIPYLATQYQLDKAKGTRLIDEQLQKLNTPKARELDLKKIAELYGLLGNRLVADSMNRAVEARYAGARKSFIKEKDFSQKEAMLQDLINQFGLTPGSSADDEKLQSLYVHMAKVCMNAKDCAKFDAKPL